MRALALVTDPDSLTTVVTLPSAVMVPTQGPPISTAGSELQAANEAASTATQIADVRISERLHQTVADDTLNLTLRVPLDSINEVALCPHPASIRNESGK